MFKRWMIIVLGGTLSVVVPHKDAQADNVDLTQLVPDDTEATGGYSAGFGNAGVASHNRLGSVRLNPALMSGDKQYTIGANFFFPAIGRNFGQLTIIDSYTSNTALGLEYSAYQDNKDVDPGSEQHPSYARERGSLAFAHSFGRLSLGATINYYGVFTPQPDLGTPGDTIIGPTIGEDQPTRPEAKEESGTSFGYGVLFDASPKLRIGFAQQNVGTDEKAKTVAPSSYSIGATYMPMGGQNLAINVDYRVRNRLILPPAANTTLDFENNVVPSDDLVSRETEAATEQMVIGSVYANLYQATYVTGSYGVEIGGTGRQQAGIGAGITTEENITIGVGVFRPYMKYKFSQKAVHLSAALRF